MERYFEINESGHNVRCKLYCSDPQQIRKVVVFGHGFGGHKDNGAAETFAGKMLAKYKGTALITFNWPSHGDDVKKKISLADCAVYLELVTGFAREKYGAQLYAYATSFGGYLVLKYLAERGNPFQRIALRCPAVNMYEVLTRAIMTADEADRIHKGKDVPVGFDRKVLVSPRFLQELEEKDIRNYDYLDNAEDILILHGTADEIVPFEAARNFCEAQLIEFVPIEGADHRFRNPLKMEEAIKQILTFFFG